MRIAATLIVLLTLTGCATPLPYAPNDQLIVAEGVESAIARLTDLMQRTIIPTLSEVRVTSDALEFRLHYTGQFGPQPGLRRIAWDRVQRVDIYANHRTFVYDNLDRELVWVEFNSGAEAREFADLVLSFRAGKSGN